MLGVRWIDISGHTCSGAPEITMAVDTYKHAEVSMYREREKETVSWRNRRLLSSLYIHTSISIYMYVCAHTCTATYKRIHRRMRFLVS